MSDHRSRQTVVIVGATSGLGAALARELAACGAQVVIAGRRGDLASSLAESIGSDVALGVECDVRREEDLAALWETASARFGHIDHWINNAARGHGRHRIDELTAAEIDALLATNLGGALLGARQALLGMTKQGGGRIWLTEGLGSSGPAMAGTSVYSATKAGATSAYRILRKECRRSPVQIGFLRPGIMATDVTMGENEAMPALAQRLSDPPAVVARDFAPRILRARRGVQRITWLTPPRMARRLIGARPRGTSSRRPRVGPNSIG